MSNKTCVGLLVYFCYAIIAALGLTNLLGLMCLIWCEVKCC